MPFFSVSCSNNPEDAGVNFSGLEISTGKNIGEYRQDGNLLGFILFVPPVVLLLLSFVTDEIKNSTVHRIYKYILFILPVFDIFAVFIIRFAFNAVFLRTVRNYNLEKIPVKINIKYGFVLYIIFNAVVFIFAVIHYFTKRE